MRLLLLKVYFLFLIFIPTIYAQFYRGELEPRYSRKTPFRQQTDIPDPVFGIGHGIRRFNGDKSSREEQPLSPFFGERREPGRRNSGREDGRDYEENGEDENRFGRNRRPFGFGRHGSPDDQEGRDGPFPKGDHDFGRPNLPDPSVVKERFDKERNGKNQRREEDGEEENHQKPSRRRERPEEDGHHKDEEEEEEERRPRRPPPRSKENYEDEEEEGRGRSYRPRHEDSDRPRQHYRGREPDSETENIAETPSKVVGLNMQMVAGVYPKEKKGPVVEDVDKRGGRFVDKPDEKEQQKFFRGSEPDEDEDRSEQHRKGGREQKYEEPRDRRPARGDSGESEKGSRGEKFEGRDGRQGNQEGRDEKRREGRQEESGEKPHREEQRGPQGPPPQQAPPPPKPQIPPFPAFPKFPSFGGFKPFQPDFPTRSFGGNGGFAGGPWNEPGRPSGREAASGEDVGSSEDRSGQDGRRVHQQNAPSAPSDNSGSHDDTAERRHSTSDNSKENERRGKGQEGEHGKDKGQDSSRPKEEPREEHREEHREEVPEKVNQGNPPPPPPPARKEFPTPGRFVTNIRAKKSGEILDATTAPSTTSTTSTAITFPVISTTTLPSTGIMLPTEAIVTKLRSIVNQRIKVV
ncbi:unnamed protein product [Caenorhabditis nigoni]